jgi:hypothetical protein
MLAPQRNSIFVVGTGHKFFTEVSGEDANMFSVAPKFEHSYGTSKTKLLDLLL